MWVTEVHLRTEAVGSGSDRCVLAYFASLNFLPFPFNLEYMCGKDDLKRMAVAWSLKAPLTAKNSGG